MPPTGFEPAIPENERSHIHTLEGVASGIGKVYNYFYKYLVAWSSNGEELTRYNYCHFGYAT